MVNTGPTPGMENTKLLTEDTEMAKKIVDKENMKKHNTKKTELRLGTWNIRRGLVRRENEIERLLLDEGLDLLFLTETDSKKMNIDNYKIKGFYIVTPEVTDEQDMVRIVAIVREEAGVEVKPCEGLMSADFPSVWLEVVDKWKSSTIIGGFYRQWSSSGVRSRGTQIEEIETFCNQIDKIATTNSNLIITGDANLCAEKWQRSDYDHKGVANPLLQCLSRNGLDIQNVGYTFQSDNLRPDGSVSHSALDHVYTSSSIKDLIQVKKLKNSSTDHLPVVAYYNLAKTKPSYKRTITKRSYKNFTAERWNSCLENQDWSAVENCQNVEEMVSEFQENITAALDQIAPVKTFKIRSNHKFGLTEGTKDLMKKRDSTRAKIRDAEGGEKTVLQNQYKILRNRVTAQIRKENVEQNNTRIKEASSEGELWKVANEVLNPKKENTWKIETEDGEVLTGETEVADAFNSFFIEKVDKLKTSIDQKLVEDPLARLKERMKNNKNTLEFKPVSQKQLRGHLKKLKKKTSSGLDGLSQKHLIMGAGVLVAPLATIINKSIIDGIFPQQWKEAVVTPILKKGSAQLLSNYRPVSCLPAASKLLEIVICSQLSEYLEAKDLLPKNQHGFRPRRSTMSAWNEIQLDWAERTEQGLITGVLLWDLSAAFDTLDCEGVCKKLEQFGLQPRSVNWIRSFLTGRSQRVRIGSCMSTARNVPTGVPQGGVLSPLIFVLFVSDLQDWLRHSTAPTYADDTTTGTSGRTADETVEKMEADAKEVLKFMASNGLVANAKKTSLLLLNYRQTTPPLSVKIGSDIITRQSTATLLGIKCQENQQWSNQINGKGGLLSGLNSRIFIIRRMRSHLSETSVLKLVDGLFMSKIRYGLQLYGKVRMSEEDPTNGELKAIQVVQNNLLRMLNRSKIKDKVSIDFMLKKFNMMSVNQLNAQIKLLEIWKSLNVNDYPLKLKRHDPNKAGSTTRACASGKLCEVGQSTKSQNTCVSDAIRLWNKAPASVTNCDSIYVAKKEIKKFAKTLPI